MSGPPASGLDKRSDRPLRDASGQPRIADDLANRGAASLGPATISGCAAPAVAGPYFPTARTAPGIIVLEVADHIVDVVLGQLVGAERGHLVCFARGSRRGRRHPACGSSARSTGASPRRRGSGASRGPPSVQPVDDVAGRRIPSGTARARVLGDPGAVEPLVGRHVGGDRRERGDEVGDVVELLRASSFELFFHSAMPSHCGTLPK